MPNKTSNPLFSAIFSLMPTMVRGVPGGKILHSLLFIYAWTEIHISQKLSNWLLTFHFTNNIIKADGVKLIPSRVIWKGDSLEVAVLLQNRKFYQIPSNLVWKCSSHPNLENEYTHFMFLTINHKVIGSWKLPNHASCRPLLLNVSWREWTVHALALLIMWPYLYFRLSPAAMANQWQYVSSL